MGRGAALIFGWNYKLKMLPWWWAGREAGRAYHMAWLLQEEAVT